MRKAPLRIAMVSPGYAPDLGGVETHVRHLAHGLAGRGHDITVYTQSTRSLLAQVGNSTRMRVGDGAVHVRRFQLPLEGNRDVAAPALAVAMRRELRRYDLVHSHGYHALPALFAALAPRRGPLVFTPHYHGHGHTPALDRLHRVYRPVFGERLVGRANRLIAVSDSEASLLQKHFGPEAAAKAVVVLNGTSRRPVDEPFPDLGDLVVLAVGRLEAYKRVDLLVDAMRLLPDQARLVICGDGPMREALKRDSRRYGDRVLVPGAVSAEDLARWTATARVFVTLSSREAFGITLAEASAAGLPCVASDIPSHREIAGFGGHIEILADTRPEAVSAAILRAAAVTDVPASTLPDWDEVAAHVEDIYLDAVAAGARSSQ